METADQAINQRYDHLPAMLTLALIRQHIIPMSERTFHRWIETGAFPKPDIQIGEKTRLWRRETIIEWENDNREKTSRGERTQLPSRAV